MKTRREFLSQTGRGMVGGMLWRALPPGLCVTLLTPRRAMAEVVLDPLNPIPPFIVEPAGSQRYAPGNVLQITDVAGDIINFHALDSDAAQDGPDLDIVTTFQVLDEPVHAGDEVGVRFVINEGVEKRIVVACIVKGGQLGIGLAAGDTLTDQNSYPAFVQVNYKAVTSVRFRRTNEGAEIIEVNGVAPATRQFVARAQLPTRNRVTPTVEFGCPSAEAEVTVNIHAFASERVNVVPGMLTFTQLRIRDGESSDRLRLRADFTLGIGADGINPATEPVNIKLTTPSGGQFYPPPSTNPITGFEVRGNPPRRRWSISELERARTGIERFDFDEAPNNTGAVFFRDAMNVPAIDFSIVDVEIVVGDDRLTGRAELVENPPGSGTWRLRREN
jgi:hypothetical protein